MKTKYYRIQPSGPGAGHMRHGGIILAIQGDTEWLLTDELYVNMVGIYRYRERVDGYPRPWPLGAAKAENKAAEMEKALINSGLCLYLSDLSPQLCRKLLNL